jgi:hypothetical protein
MKIGYKSPHFKALMTVLSQKSFTEYKIAQQAQTRLYDNVVIGVDA